MMRREMLSARALPPLEGELSLSPQDVLHRLLCRIERPDRRINPARMASRFLDEDTSGTN
jgi:hypothetical protein